MPNNPGCLTSFLRVFNKGNKDSYKKTTTEPEQLPYLVRDDFLSAAEANFFHILQNALQGRQLICPKVSLGDLFYVRQPNQNMIYYNKISRKHVDFLLCDPKTLQPTLGIELDDSSHNQPDRIERDAFVEEVFAAAGLPLVRVPVRTSYSTQELAQLFKNALGTKSASTSPSGADENRAWSSPEAPFCPNCGRPMVRRTARRGPNAGQEFFGCPNYPKCQTVIAIERKNN
jgi:hypothetical protein